MSRSDRPHVHGKGIVGGRSLPWQPIQSSWSVAVCGAVVLPGERAWKPAETSCCPRHRFAELAVRNIGAPCVSSVGRIANIDVRIAASPPRNRSCARSEADSRSCAVSSGDRRYQRLSASPLRRAGSTWLPTMKAVLSTHLGRTSPSSVDEERLVQGFARAKPGWLSPEASASTYQCPDHRREMRTSQEQIIDAMTLCDPVAPAKEVA